MFRLLTSRPVSWRSSLVQYAACLLLGALCATLLIAVFSLIARLGSLLDSPLLDSDLPLPEPTTRDYMTRRLSSHGIHQALDLGVVVPGYEETPWGQNTEYLNRVFNQFSSRIKADKMENSDLV